MRHWLRDIVCGAAAAVFPLQLAHAGPEECREAMDQYIIVASLASDALATYQMCILSSLGQDSCALEFSMLQSAQAEFESAVENYQSECQ